MSRVAFELDSDGVAHVRLVRPESRNAIDQQMVEELARAVARCRGPEVRAVLISAEGPTFTVGGDLAHFGAHLDDLGGALEAVVPRFHDTLHELAMLHAPVVAAIQGAAAGGGLGLVWCSDLALAAEGAQFATGFARLGLSGDGGSAWWLPRLVGIARARQLLIGGRVLDAREALEWGLISEVTAPDALASRAELLTAELARGPSFALASIRRLLIGSGERALAEHLALETEAMIDCGGTADAVEGVSAFLERRSPSFSTPAD